MTAKPDDDVVEQLGRGEVEAIAELFTAYGSYLRAIVRRELPDCLRAKFDSVDVIQSVWVQVIHLLGRDGWRVASQNHLRALLVTIAKRRLVSRARREGRGTRLLGREVRDEGLASTVEEDFATVSDMRHDPPDEVAEATDLWDKMLRLTPPEHHLILLLKRDGVPLGEIASQTGLHVGSVRRILRRLSLELAMREGSAPTPGLDDMGADE